MEKYSRVAIQKRQIKRDVRLLFYISLCVWCSIPTLDASKTNPYKTVKSIEGDKIWTAMRDSTQDMHKNAESYACVFARLFFYIRYDH